MVGTTHVNGTAPATGRQAAHALKVEFLDALAVLLGCESALGGAFPDGRRPDVLRADLGRRALFVGDAKHSERPGSRETQARLLGYMRWLSSHVRAGGIGVFAVCFARESDTGGWAEALSTLEREVGLERTTRGGERFEPGLVVVWSTFEPGVPPGLALPPGVQA